MSMFELLRHLVGVEKRLEPVIVPDCYFTRAMFCFEMFLEFFQVIVVRRPNLFVALICVALYILI